MATLKTIKTKRKSREAMIKIPLSAIRCILRYPKEKKIVCEINTREVERLNEAKTLDEIINEARLDYALHNYKTFVSPKSLVAELHS